MRSVGYLENRTLNQGTEARLTQNPVLGAAVFGTPIQIFEGNIRNQYNCVRAIKTFKHKDYCCPFCSHGETIQLKVYDHYRGRLQGTYRKAYLECEEGCMSYGVFESTFCRGYTEKEVISSIIQEALEAFEKIIKYTKDIEKFVMV